MRLPEGDKLMSSSQIDQIRDFEYEYYSGMPAIVKQLADMRDTGIDLVQHGSHYSERDQGYLLLEKSVNELSDAPQDYVREYFASLYMLARGSLLLGQESDVSGSIAREAVEVTPAVPEELREIVEADQYVAIASGRLSLILSAVNPRTFGEYEYYLPYREDARKMAGMALKTCRKSEDRQSMLFADGSMDEAARTAARRRHTITAAAATASLMLPGLGLRTQLAKRLCA